MSPFWFKYLPNFLRRRLEGRHNVQNVIDNTGWLFFDKILRMAGGLLLGVLIARYLGPEQYGLLNYATAFVALFGAFATLGLDGIVVRDIVKEPARRNELLGSSFVLKLIGGLLTTVGILLVIYFLKRNDDYIRLIVSLTSLGLILQAFDAVEFHYRSEVKSKYPILAKDAAFIVFILVRVWLLTTHAGLQAFVVASLLESVFGAFLMLVLYQRQGNSIINWKCNAGTMRRLLKDSWPLVLSGIVIMIYMRIDQVMIGEMLGNKAVGTYSAALRLSETWYFIPLIISSSVAPTIINAKKVSEEQYLARLQKLYNLMTIMSLGIALIVSLCSSSLINLLYGDQFLGAGLILAIHIWSAVFYFLGVAASNWFLVENQQRLVFMRTLYGVVANIGLNFLLIPKFGAAGAAIATLVTQIVVSYLSNAFSRRTRIVFRMQTIAIFQAVSLRPLFSGIASMAHTGKFRSVE